MLQRTFTHSDRSSFSGEARANLILPSSCVGRTPMGTPPSTNFSSFQSSRSSSATSNEGGYQSFGPSCCRPLQYHIAQLAGSSSQNLTHKTSSQSTGTYSKSGPHQLCFREPHRRHSELDFKNPNGTLSKHSRTSSTVAHEGRSASLSSKMCFAPSPMSRSPDKRFIPLSSPSRVLSRGTDVVAEGQMVNQIEVDKSIRHSLLRAINTDASPLPEELFSVKLDHQPPELQSAYSKLEDLHDKSHYVSFASMNLKAPPSPPPSINYLS